MRRAPSAARASASCAIRSSADVPDVADERLIASVVLRLPVRLRCARPASRDRRRLSADTSMAIIAAHRPRPPTPPEDRSCWPRRSRASRACDREALDRPRSSARDRSSTTSVRSATVTRPRAPARSLPAPLHRSVSRRPAVSTSATERPPMSARSVTRSRVVPGIGVTIARLALSSVLNRLDLPTLGVPTIATWAPSRINRPRALPLSSSIDPRAQIAQSAPRPRCARRSDSPRRENRATLRDAP